MAAAGGAGGGLGAGLGAGALAGLAVLHGGNADAGLGAVGRFFERDFEVVAQVRAPIDAGAALAAAEDVAEDVGEGIGATAEPGARSRTHAGLRIHARVTVLVVGGPLGGLAQHLVGFLGLLEQLLGLGVVRIAVRVVLHGQLAIGLLEIFLRGVPVHAEHLVIVALCH